MLTQKILKYYLNYNKNIGVFTWLINKKGGAKKGDVAGTKSRGYIRIELNGKYYMAHRLAWLYEYGKFPQQYIDHINRVKNDNRINNLRDVSRYVNARNKKISVRNRSGTIGVHWCARTKKWRSYINVNKQRTYLGYFKKKRNGNNFKILNLKNI